jgi:hypothetical protein
MPVEYNREEILREYRPLWENPQKQRQAMKLERLLKEKLWQKGARKWQAHLNLERLLKTPPEKQDAKLAVLMKFVRLPSESLASLGNWLRRKKLAIRATVAGWLSALARIFAA